MEQRSVNVEALLQLEGQDVHDRMVGTVSISAPQPADLGRVMKLKLPLCILAVPRTKYFKVYSLLFPRIVSTILNHVEPSDLYLHKYKYHLLIAGCWGILCSVIFIWFSTLH